MVKLETTLLDRFINGSFAGKRVIGQPLKYNLKTKGGNGWIELVFHPQGRVEEFLSKTLRFIHPYLFYVTLRFQAEKAREGGFRIEDIHENKFHKEPYIYNHVYAQYFHPETLLERVRDQKFYRLPRTIFKGFTVPDWARPKEKHGWEIDTYSRQAWDDALDDMKAEWTPTPFHGARQGPNPLQLFRLEFMGHGFSSRLFYNEVPHIGWWRGRGHQLDNPEDEKERFKKLYSFTHANQNQPLVFGIDTTTEEGRKEFRAEYEAMCEMAPELMKKEDLVFPHEMPAFVPNEPHFMRVWQHYREHVFKNVLEQASEQKKITQGDLAGFHRFVGNAKTPSFNIYILAASGKLDHLKGDDGFEATQRVFKALGFDSFKFSKKTSEPFEEQFWRHFDLHFNVTEVGLRKELPFFCVDPSNRAKVEALLASKDAAHISHEKTSRISA